MDWGAVLTAGVMPYLQEAKTLLDSGCGNGNDALRLAREGFHVVGLDVSASVIEQAESRAREEGLEPGFYLEQGGFIRRYFDQNMLERLLAGWKIEVMELLEVQNSRGQSKRCWRLVVRLL